MILFRSLRGNLPPDPLAGGLEEKNVMFISIKENIDTATPIGKAMMYVTMVFAQMERETIAARVTDNMIGLAKKGFWTGGNPPYGYRREKIEVNGKKHVTIVPVPEAADYVEWIFDTFLFLQASHICWRSPGHPLRVGRVGKPQGHPADRSSHHP